MVLIPAAKTILYAVTGVPGGSPSHFIGPLFAEVLRLILLLESENQFLESLYLSLTIAPLSGLPLINLDSLSLGDLSSP